MLLQQKRSNFKVTAKKNANSKYGLIIGQTNANSNDFSNQVDRIEKSQLKLFSDLPSLPASEVLMILSLLTLSRNILHARIKS